MGTFTKAFGSVGGYISGSKELIEYLRARSFGTVYSTSMSPPCAQQALSALRVITGKDGTNQGALRLQRLHENSNYFRRRMIEEGFHVYGDKDSPVVLMMTYHCAMMAEFSRALIKRGVHPFLFFFFFLKKSNFFFSFSKIAIVTVGFPVTKLLLARVRFCLSSGHTIEELEKAIQEISEIGGRIGMKYAKYAGRV